MIAVARNILLCAALLQAFAGCGDSEPEPVQAAKSYMAALQAHDVGGLLPLMTVEAVQQLEVAAVAASEQIGGRRNIAPSEMVQVVDFDERFRVFEAELLDMDEESATVRLRGAGDAELVLSLRQQDGRWRVSMPSLVPAGA